MRASAFQSCRAIIARPPWKPTKNLLHMKEVFCGTCGIGFVLCFFLALMCAATGHHPSKVELSIKVGMLVAVTPAIIVGWDRLRKNRQGRA